MTYLISAEERTREDIELCEAYIGDPDVWPVAKDLARRQLAWLKEAPRRSLLAKSRRIMRYRLGLLRAARRAGTPISKQSEGYQIQTKPKAPSRLPAWMNDPSLLPKRPPGRAHD
jgi:hypothetical protein